MQLQSDKPLGRHQKKGYTLIEILVGITIIGLLFSFGYVSFREFAGRQALVGTVKQVEGDLRLAQGKALSGEKPEDTDCDSPKVLHGYLFRIISGGTTYRLTASCSGGNKVVKSVDLPAGFTISSTIDPILFKVLGQGTDIPSGQSATITITQVGTGKVSIVMVTSGGEIK